MKKVNSVQNFLNVLNDNNFVTLYYVKNYETQERESICFITQDEALKHLKYLSINNKLKGKLHYIAETYVYFG